MARTPFMDAVLRAYRTVRGAEREGLPLDEHAQRQAEARVLGRRQLLQLSAGALVLDACATTRPSAKNQRPVLAIVGGGIAGLHCAHRLQRGGIQADVYDAGKRWGGRIFSDRKTFPDGMHCELGGELIDSGHATMRVLASELGLELLDYQGDPGIDTFHLGGRRYTEAQLLDEFRPVVAAIQESLSSRRDETKGVTHDDPNGLAELDRLSIPEWLDSKGISGPARTLLEVAYRGEYGLELERCNVLNLLLLVSTETQRLELFGESDERLHTRDGNDAFIQRLTAHLPADRLHLEHRLVRLKQGSDGRYRLSFERSGQPFETVADHVVLALPFSILREVELQVALPALKKKAIAEMGYGTNAKLMVGFASRPWRDAGFNGSSLSDLSYQQTWETSRMQNPRSRAGILTNFTGGRFGVDAGRGSPEERRDAFLSELDRVWPGAKSAASGRVARMHWPTAPLARGSYSAYEVGQYTAFAGAELTRVGNLHFCGEHTSLDYQGFMEGGALTGAIAAAEVAADLGIRLADHEGVHGRRILQRVQLARLGGGRVITGALRARAA